MSEPVQAPTTSVVGPPPISIPPSSADEQPSYPALVSVVLAISAVLLWSRIGRARSRRSAVAAQPTYFVEPPSDIDPALVAVVAGDGVVLDRRAAAATVVHLAARNVLRIDGYGSDRFVATCSATSDPALSATDRVVLEALTRRLGGTGGVVFDGALWSEDRPAWWRSYRRAVLRDAYRRGLIRREFPIATTYAAILAAALVGALLADFSVPGLLGALAATAFFATLPYFAGWELTAAGEREQSSWRAFGRFLRTHSELQDATPPAVTVWGNHLAYATALGLAPECERILAPRAGRQRIPVTLDRTTQRSRPIRRASH